MKIMWKKWRNKTELTDGEIKYIIELNRVPILTEEEELSLLMRAINGDDEAKMRYVESLFLHVMFNRLAENAEVGASHE